MSTFFGQADRESKLKEVEHKEVNPLAASAVPYGQGHSFGQVNINDGGVAHLGDQYISVYQDDVSQEQKQWLQFLHSLRYPEMNARYNEITDINRGTFQWVFGSNSQALQNQSKLAQWLASGDEIFVVQGKPGSGKSTFMKFVFEHPQTQSLLQQWSAGRPVTLLFHSFWLIGKKIQHSWKGFLASILSQALMKNPHLWNLCNISNWRDCLADWSEKDLEVSLKSVLCSSTFDKCLVVDALDEFDQQDNEHRLLEFLRELNSPSNRCKTCLSTRPQVHILDFFRFSPSLCLHDLTKADIFAYVTKTIKQRLGSTDWKDEQVSMLIFTICTKADGVFLWVYYVVQHVCRNIHIEDNFRVLIESINLLSPAIGKLYQTMWLQHNHPKIHTDEAAKIFCVCRRLPMPLFQVAVAIDESLMKQYLRSPQPIEDEQITKLCDRARKRLFSRTAGLLECFTRPMSLATREKDSFFFQHNPVLASRGMRLRKMRVKYLHRTVQNFLTENEHGRAISAKNNQHFQHYCDMLWIQSYLACLIENVVPLTSDSLHELFFSSSWQGSLQSHLVDDVDRVCDQLIRERLNMSQTQPGNWFLELQKSTSLSICHDFEGVMVASSVHCTEYMLETRGERWSAYYKGYLALCSVLLCVGIGHNRENSDEIMLDNLTLLKQRGADLGSIHPYMSSNGTLAMRSAASRLLHEGCCKLLNTQSKCPRLSYFGKVIETIMDVDIDTEDLTLMWHLISNRWRASLTHGMNVVFTFQASSLRTALNKAVLEHKPLLTLTNQNDEFSAHIVQRIRKAFFSSLGDLPSKVNIGKVDPNHGNRFLKCPSINTQFALDAIFNKRPLSNWTDETTCDSATLEASDVDCNTTFDAVFDYLQTMDPNEEIKNSEWKEKGVLREYFKLHK